MPLHKPAPALLRSRCSSLDDAGSRLGAADQPRFHAARGACDASHTEARRVALDVALPEGPALRVPHPRASRSNRPAASHRHPGGGVALPRRLRARLLRNEHLDLVVAADPPTARGCCAASSCGGCSSRTGAITWSECSILRDDGDHLNSGEAARARPRAQPHVGRRRRRPSTTFLALVPGADRVHVGLRAGSRTPADVTRQVQDVASALPKEVQDFLVFQLT